MHTETTAQAPATKLSMGELTALVLELQKKVAQLEAAAQPAPKGEVKEMTDEDARSILTGAHAGSKHKDAAAALGLSYGQVYSCRLEHTFKHIHKEMRDQGKKNPWVK